MKAGKTVDQAVPEYKVPAKYRGYVPARTRVRWREIQPGGSLQGAEEVAADKRPAYRLSATQEKFAASLVSPEPCTSQPEPKGHRGRVLSTWPLVK